MSHPDPTADASAGHASGPVRDALRLCFGTLTVLPVGAPGRLTRRRAAAAMAMAPLAGALVGVAAGASAVAADAVRLPGLLAGAAAVAAGAVATRALHLDGVADTLDGMAATPHGGDPGRALDVMRRGDVGPAGVVALVLVVLAQAAAIAAVAEVAGGWMLLAAVVVAWTVSRAVVPLLCTPLFRAARPDGLGAGVLRSVPVTLAVTVAAGVVAVAGLVGGWPGAVTAGLALAAGTALAAAVARRLHGLTGDVLGACVELSLLVALTGAAATGRAG